MKKRDFSCETLLRGWVAAIYLNTCYSLFETLLSLMWDIIQLFDVYVAHRHKKKVLLVIQRLTMKNDKKANERFLHCHSEILQTEDTIVKVTPDLRGCPPVSSGKKFVCAPF